MLVHRSAMCKHWAPLSSPACTPTFPTPGFPKQALLPSITRPSKSHAFLPYALVNSIHSGHANACLSLHSIPWLNTLIDSDMPGPLPNGSQVHNYHALTLHRQLQILDPRLTILPQALPTSHARVQVLGRWSPWHRQPWQDTRRACKTPPGYRAAR